MRRVMHVVCDAVRPVAWLERVSCLHIQLLMPLQHLAVYRPSPKREVYRLRLSTGANMLPMSSLPTCRCLHLRAACPRTHSVCFTCPLLQSSPTGPHHAHPCTMCILWTSALTAASWPLAMLRGVRCCIACITIRRLRLLVHVLQVRLVNV